MMRALKTGCIVLLAGVMAGCCGCRKPEKKVAELPVTMGPRLEVVGSWEELMRVKPVGSGEEEVRLGIEAAECAAHTGVLVYCVPTNVKQLGSNGRQPGEILGPVFLQVRRIGATIERALDMSNWQGAELKLGEQAHYAATAAVGQAGDYDVQVLNAAGEILAHRVIRARATRLAWMSLEGVELSNEPGASVYKVVPGMAVPKINGAERLRLDTLSMLRLFPKDADAELQVSMAKGVVTVKCPHWVEDNVSWNWMVRWWVNDKPVLLPYVRREVAATQLAARLIQAPVEFQFRMHVDRELLGAKEGDVISFELLYCNHGFTTSEEEGAAEAMRPFDTSPVRLSRRVVYQP
jgi:hypothetical protein